MRFLLFVVAVLLLSAPCFAMNGGTGIPGRTILENTYSGPKKVVVKRSSDVGEYFVSLGKTDFVVHAFGNNFLLDYPNDKKRDEVCNVMNGDVFCCSISENTPFAFQDRGTPLGDIFWAIYEDGPRH